MNPLLKQTHALIETYGRFLGLSLCPCTCKGETNRLKRFFTMLCMAKKDYNTTTTEDIESYLSLHDYNQDYKAQNVLSLRRFYNYLRDKHIVEQNPAEQITVRFALKNSLTIAPRKARIKRILRKLEKDRNAEGLLKRVLVELAYGSGLRRGELVTLNVADINMTDQTVHVLGKGRRERVVPLSRRCVSVLKEYLQNIPSTQKPLFVRGNDQRLKAWQVHEVVKKSTGLNAHALRHACATHMLLNGCDIRHIQQLLGHQSIRTTEVYTKLDKEDLRKVINQKHPGRCRSTTAGAGKPL